MDLKLLGQNALITGASKGLGFATAKVLLDEGVNVAINSRDPENLKAAKRNLRSEGHAEEKMHFLAGDVTDESLCENLAEDAKKSLGGIDILITNSGGPPAGKFEELDSKQWDDAINLSFLSHLHLIKYCLPFLKQSINPSVLAITSFTVKYPLDNLILSNTIRAATAALIKSLSIELGENGIRFNSILPGWTLTDRVNQLLAIRAQKNTSSIEVEKKKITDAIPLGRMAEPEEFARTAAFLISPAASYINGVLLTVDGGITRGLL